MTLRVLHYNWAQFDDPEFRGGGVSVYLRNLLGELAGRPEYELTVLSSGHHYTWRDRSTRYERTSNLFEDRGVRSFRILNSPVKAPAHDMFYDMDTWRSDPESARVFGEVLRDQGPFDVVVLHSMEGISSEVLKLKERFPHIRFVYMWHNYMPLCPQIELLHQGENDCTDYEGGAKCLGCIGGFHKRDPLIQMQRLGSSLEFARLSGRPLGNFLFGAAIGSYKLAEASRWFFKDMGHSLRGAFSRNEGAPARGGFQPVDVGARGPGPQGVSLKRVAEDAGQYRVWRELNTTLLDAFDAHFCVSDLVKRTITGLGVDPARVHVTPLGMDLHADAGTMQSRAAAKAQHDKLRLSFIGYGIPSKGLPFITEALTQLDSPLLKERAELVIYARLSDHQIQRLAPLYDRFADVRVVQGYQRRDLARIASDIDLNIVPSIWRETYNQVAYELLCLGTPSLLSSSVGLGMFYERAPDFVFRSGDHEDFGAKLERIVSDPSLIRAFWQSPPSLPSMAQHIEGVEAILRDHERMDDR